MRRVLIERLEQRYGRARDFRSVQVLQGNRKRQSNEGTDEILRGGAEEVCLEECRHWDWWKEKEGIVLPWVVIEIFTIAVIKKASVIT